MWPAHLCELVVRASDIYVCCIVTLACLWMPDVDKKKVKKTNPSILQECCWIVWAWFSPHTCNARRLTFCFIDVEMVVG